MKVAKVDLEVVFNAAPYHVFVASLTHSTFRKYNCFEHCTVCLKCILQSGALHILDGGYCGYCGYCGWVL